MASGIHPVQFNFFISMSSLLVHYKCLIILMLYCMGCMIYDAIICLLDFIYILLVDICCANDVCIKLRDLFTFLTKYLGLLYIIHQFTLLLGLSSSQYFLKFALFSLTLKYLLKGLYGEIFHVFFCILKCYKLQDLESQRLKPQTQRDIHYES